MFRTLLCCVLLSGPASAAQIEVISENSNPALITVSGEFQVGDERKFSDIALRYENAVVKFNSPGGSVFAGVEIGKAIRLKGFSTLVEENSLCASACGYAWLGGVRRSMAPGSRIGFHAAFVQQNGENKETGLGNALVGAYLNQLGLSQAAVAYVASAPPDGMTWLTSEDASRVGIEVAVVSGNLSDSNNSVSAGGIRRMANSDLLGHDLERMPIKGLTLRECERECLINSDCKAFTFNAAYSACFLYWRPSLHESRFPVWVQVRS
jgi:hypothetical protein